MRARSHWPGSKHPTGKFLAAVLRRASISLLITTLLAACGPASPATVIPSQPAPEATLAPPASPTIPPTRTTAPSMTPEPPATQTSSPQPTTTVIVEGLKAQVAADRLSCRYGPGPEYLYLYGLRKGANIVLNGRTGGSNWVWVEGRNPCWVNATYLEIQGDMNALPTTYPEPARLPRSPYYRTPPVVLSATRDGDKVTVRWLEITLTPGDEEDASMFIYIVELWRCENGQFIFDPVATNEPELTFTDQPGCSQPSHGRIFFQEKHGYDGPAEIPWP